MKKIKILYTINYLTNGGPTRVLQNIIKKLPKSEYEIYLLTLINKNNEEITQELKKQGVSLVELNLTKGKLEIIKNRKKIIKIINNISPDIIHVNGIEMAYIVSRKEVKGKKVTTIHNNMYEDYKYSYGKIKGKIIEFFHIKWLKKFDINICCSSTSYNYLKKRIKNVTYVRNGGDVKHSSPNPRNHIRKELGLKNSDILYVYGGVINSRKRVYELIKLFKNSYKNNEYLLIVGDGPLMNNCKEISDKHIFFTGFKENIIDYFDASDIYASNSSSEGFSISVIEALSSGLLCLLSSISSHKECFEIDPNYYIGEYFNDNDFESKKNKVSINLKKIDKEKIIKFQNVYLSDSSMANGYIKEYSKLVRK